MPPYVVTSKTQSRYLLPPQGPVVCNLGSEFAQGLVAWWPLNDAHKVTFRDLSPNPATKYPLTLSGTLGIGAPPFGGTGFANAASTANYLNKVATPPVTAIPYTLSTWVHLRDTTDYGREMALIHMGNSGGTNYVSLIYDGANGEGKGAHKAVCDFSGGASQVAASSTSLGAAGPAMITAVCTSINSGTQAVYLNATGAGAAASNLNSPSGWDRYTVGAYRDTATFIPLSGVQWNAAIWNVGLTAAQVQRLYDPNWRWDLYYLPGRTAYDRFAANSTGGSTFTRSLSDNLAVSDAFARVADGKRAYTDNLAESDTFARLANGVRAFTDNLALSDSFLRRADGLRAVNDTAALSDAYARRADGKRQAADSVGTSDSYARVADAKRNPSDNLGLADALARVADAKRQVADALGLADAYARVANAFRAVTDTLALADTLARVANALRAFTDTTGLSDAFARRADAKRSLTDLLGLADSATLAKIGAGVLLIAVADALGLSDAAARRADAARALSEAVGLADALARVADAKRQATDSVGLPDAFSRRADANRQATDAVALADTLARRANAARSLTESLSLADAYARRADAIRVVTDAVGLAELFDLLADQTLPYLPYLPAVGTVARDPGRTALARGPARTARPPG